MGLYARSSSQYSHEKDCVLQAHLYNNAPNHSAYRFHRPSNRLERLSYSSGKDNLVSSDIITIPQTEQECTTDSPQSHLHNIGRIIEDMENKMRTTIQEIYFGKTKDILNDLRSLTDLKTVKSQAAVQADLIGRLNERVKT